MRKDGRRAANPYILPLDEADLALEPLVGGKSARLGALARAGHRVPPGFCVTIRAYERFVDAGRLTGAIQMELERKRFESMRWEELWDAALRIRSAFTARPLPADVNEAIARALAAFPGQAAWAVRSSAPGEDSAGCSFAGLHESCVGLVGTQAVLDAVRLVWASLWSDAAMLYRRELALDPSRSRMAVLVQAMREETVSGVAFGCDPRRPAAAIAVVEAVPGRCAGLVDGEIDPDRWELCRPDGRVTGWRPGNRAESFPATPLLGPADLANLLQVIHGVEALFGWPPDIEWTGRRDRFTLLQARPVTSPASDGEDNRGWYLTLRPGMARLKKLRTRVAEELIPALEAEGRRLAAEDLEPLSAEQLAMTIEARLAAFQRWNETYRDEFIPFAHGIRNLAVYYNDAVHPPDPYEFLGLLKGEDLLATRRNAALLSLADILRPDRPLQEALENALGPVSPVDPDGWRALAPAARAAPGGAAFLAEFQRVLGETLDLVYGETRLADRPDLVLHSVLELARTPRKDACASVAVEAQAADALRQKLLDAIGPERQAEALEVIELGKLSWRLRDNDNLLLARVESQLIRALEVAARRLEREGRLAPGSRPTPRSAGEIAAALRDPLGAPVVLPAPPAEEPAGAGRTPDTAPRQLVGQPAAPGLQTGTVRLVRGSEDLGRFQAGEVLVCDAIQPMMTHLVPLAAAIVERRGGMLIHGAIIARELGIPCVNGIPDAASLLRDGDLITVDGHLGIVTVGSPEFDLELARR
ncbi:MAG: hypothetical protein KA419_19695 [Acidobacteria bacterium]|nr:hypothetical protein [Acidobacteriota bacterium]